MPKSFTSLWNRERAEIVRRCGHAGQPLTMLFGGPHGSEPGFRRFGVREGDVIYPINVSGGVLTILGWMRVARLLPIDEYIAENAPMFEGYESRFGGEATFGNWRKDHPEICHLAWTCTSEVALGSEGKFLTSEVVVPPRVLESLRFCSKRAERGLDKYIVDGRLKSSLGLQGGTYRLSETSARQFAALVAGVD